MQYARVYTRCTAHKKQPRSRDYEKYISYSVWSFTFSSSSLGIRRYRLYVLFSVSVYFFFFGQCFLHCISCCFCVRIKMFLVRIDFFPSFCIVDFFFVCFLCFVFFSFFFRAKVTFFQERRQRHTHKHSYWYSELSLHSTQIQIYTLQSHLCNEMKQSTHSKYGKKLYQMFVSTYIVYIYL